MSFHHCYGKDRGLHPFPTRRSSDLLNGWNRAPRHLERVEIEWHREHRSRLDIQEVAAAYVSATSCMSRRSEEHTSELQSQSKLVCRLLLEKKKFSRSFSMIENDTHF